MLSDVTFGITAFERPDHLRHLVDSILHYYPGARIVVADNGRKRPRLPECVRQLNVPYDCGLSRARNALVDALETPYMMLLEDDFLFTQETRIERLVDVLRADPEVGVVGGAVRGIRGRAAAYSMDIEIFRRTMYVRESSHRVRVTPTGVPYRLCDMVWNFALFRREMLKRHRWDDRLKVGEHAPYFHQIKLAAEWRVACCPAVVCFHATTDRSDEYKKLRKRAQGFFRSYMEGQGLDRYQRVDRPRCLDEFLGKPDVVILGVGHSGTSILSRMLHAAGWQAGDADKAFAESVSIRTLNQVIQKTGRLPKARARQAIDRLPSPWALKDPRFVTTLHQWLPHFAQRDLPPILVRITRDPQQLVASYQKRGARGDLRQLVEQRTMQCRDQYARWPWRKLTIEFEALAAAVSLFDARRSAGRTPARGTSDDLAHTQQSAAQFEDGSGWADAPGTFGQREAGFLGDGSPAAGGEQQSQRGWDGSGTDEARWGEPDGSGYDQRTIGGTDGSGTDAARWGQTDGSGFDQRAIGGTDGSGG